jgi:hypothetical protein
MGRPYTGADTTANAPKLKLSDLLRAGLFRELGTINAKIRWNEDHCCELEAVTLEHTRYVDLTTHHLDPYGTPYTGTQRIYLISKPSNLGRGRVLYFRCPQTHSPCRILYRAYWSNTWRSRNGYHRSLFYPIQTMSGWTRHAQREIYAEAKLERLDAMRTTTTYKGKPTRRAIRTAEMEQERERLCALGWQPANFPPRLRRILEKGL